MLINKLKKKKIQTELKPIPPNEVEIIEKDKNEEIEELKKKRKKFQRN
jgi:hypothetical protein